MYTLSVIFTGVMRTGAAAPMVRHQTGTAAVARFQFHLITSSDDRRQSIINHTQRLRHVDGAPGALDDRAVDQLAAEGDGAVAAGVGFLEGLQHFLTIVDFFSRRTEDGIDGIHLRRMNAGHAGEAELARLLGKSKQTAAIVEIDPNAIDGCTWAAAAATRWPIAHKSDRALRLRAPRAGRSPGQNLPRQR